MSNKSSVLTKLSILFGALGILALVLAWGAEFKGFALRFESRHWYNDSIILFLAAIWLKLGAIYHKNNEQ